MDKKFNFLQEPDLRGPKKGGNRKNTDDLRSGDN